MLNSRPPNSFPNGRFFAAPAFCIFVCLALLACAPKTETDRQTAGPETYFPIRIGGQMVELQLALTPAERQKGLMFRETLGQNQGMLFLFDRPEQRGFWMRNTKIPLDLGYFDADGRLLEIHKLFPYDETPVQSRSQQVLIAVETNRGWFRQNDILPGAKIDLPALKDAIARRDQQHPLFDNH